MNNRIPRLAAFGLMLVAIAACTKTDIKPNDDLTNGLNPSSGAPIAFETKDAFTKAVINNKADLEVEGNAFRVWGWFQGTTSGAMFETAGTPVTYAKDENGNLNWTYTPPRYWMNGTYDFAAVYPSTFSGTYKPSDENSTAPVLTVKDFDITKQDDLLVAYNKGIQGAGRTANDAVNLTFQHVLSSLNVQFCVDQVNIDGVDVNVIEAEVREIYFNGVSRKGEYVGDEWTNHSTETTRIGQVLSTRMTLTGDYQTILEEGLLAIPQEMKTGVSLYILADITLPTGQKMQKSWDLPLSDIPECTEWEKGKKYLYKATLTAEADIEFEEPSVQLWIQGESTGIIIPR
jgi:hypothetical protein